MILGIANIMQRTPIVQSMRSLLGVYFLMD